MTVSKPSSNNITAQISKDGNLLYADPALRRLHLKAGGIDGGKVAIPSIAAIAMLTHKLNIPLSRMIKVADQNLDIQLWVDSSIEDDIVRLSILEWNQQHIGQENEPLGINIGDPKQSENNIYFLCDLENRITSFQASEEYVAAFSDLIGENIFDIIGSDDASVKKIKDAFNNQQTLDHHLIKMAGGEEIYQFSALPRYDDNDQYTGYECYMGALHAEISDTPASMQKRISTIENGLIGGQLAPAIRQPLGRIIANAETIGSKVDGPIRENYASYARDIANAARHLLELVDDLGDLEILDHEDFKTAKDDIELNDISKRLSGLLTLKAADKSIEIIVENSDGPIKAVGEFRRVLQIGVNLITNAIRYSPKDTKVYINIGYDADCAFLSVKDQGPGIEEAMQDSIFAKFERLGRTGDGGSGLGLYISRRLAHAMDGDLIVQSQLDMGSCFTLYLPKV